MIITLITARFEVFVIAVVHKLCSRVHALTTTLIVFTRPVDWSGEDIGCSGVFDFFLEADGKCSAQEGAGGKCSHEVFCFSFLFYYNLGAARPLL